MWPGSLRQDRHTSCVNLKDAGWRIWMPEAQSEALGSTPYAWKGLGRDLRAGKLGLSSACSPVEAPEQSS